MPSEHNSSKQGDSLRRCHEPQCARRAPEEGSRLQRCSGCSRAFYCSAACQRKDWKSHKAECRLNGAALRTTLWDDELRSLGYENLSVFTKTLTEWGDAHKWALQTIVDVAVIQGCGIDSFQDPQRMVCFSLVPRILTNLPSTRNPSLAFQLRGYTFLTLEEYYARDPECRLDWERGAPIRAGLRDELRSHPSFVGLLPALFTFQGLHMSQFVYYPQFRTNPRMHSTTTLLASVRHLVLADLLELSARSINGGFPLRAVRRDNRAWVVVPGSFVRSHGTWTWQQFFADWAQYRRGQHRGLDRALVSLRSGIPPPELMLALEALAV